MKKAYLLVPALIMAMSLLPAIPALAFGGHGRYSGSHGRIERGVRGGAITRGEYRHLHRERSRLRHARRRAWSDGCLTWHERERILRMHRRFNRHVYRARHNRWVRPPRRAALVVAPLPAPRPVRVRYWSPEPQFHISGFIGDPSFALGWSFNLP